MDVMGKMVGLLAPTSLNFEEATYLSGYLVKNGVMIMDNCTGRRCPMQIGYKVDECNHKECLYRTEPVTNADRIRAMSDEELADMLWKTGRNYRAVCADPVVDYNEHRDGLIAWLKQPEGRKGD